MRKHLVRHFVFACVIFACNLSSPQQNEPVEVAPSEVLAITTDTFTPTATLLESLPTETMSSDPEANATTFDETAQTFRVVAINDTSSESINEEQASTLIDDASGLLEGLTGFTITMIDFYEGEAPINPEDGYRDIDKLVSDYLDTSPQFIPDGFVIFSYGHWGDAQLFGGYAYTSPGSADLYYRFISPAYTNEKVFYIGVVHYSHRYAVCGYGDSTNLEPIQDTSLGGECRNRDGIACVMHNGYQMCEDAVDDLYASTPTYFSASTVVHEIMHNFSTRDVASDHYGTEACTLAMQETGSQRPYDAFDDAMAESYSVICPFLYDNFVNSFLP